MERDERLRHRHEEVLIIWRRPHLAWNGSPPSVDMRPTLSSLRCFTLAQAGGLAILHLKGS